MGLLSFVRDTLEEEYKPRLYGYLDGLTHEELNWSPGDQSNSISFIVWHTTRVEDGWFHRFAQGTPTLWSSGWPEKLGVTDLGTGFGYTSEQLAAFPDLQIGPLTDYFEAVHRDTLAYLDGLDAQDLDAVPGRVPFETSTSGRFAQFSIRRMLRQVTQEVLQHLGQVGYVRGLQRGLGG